MSATEIKKRLDNLRKTLEQLTAQNQTASQVPIIESITRLQRQLKADYGEEY